MTMSPGVVVPTVRVRWNARLQWAGHLTELKVLNATGQGDGEDAEYHRGRMDALWCLMTVNDRAWCAKLSIEMEEGFIP